MRIRTISVPVLDQKKALAFYTNKLGFVKKLDIDLGNGSRWLTVVPEEEQDGPEVLLEPAPNHFEPAKVFQDALRTAGIPWTQFEVEDVEAEYQKMLKLGVEFSVKPTAVGTAKIAVLDDTCGNYIQMVELL